MKRLNKTETVKGRRKGRNCDDDLKFESKQARNDVYLSQRIWKSESNSNALGIREQHSTQKQKQNKTKKLGSMWIV